MKKLYAFAGTTALALLLGTSVAVAQQEQHDEAKPEAQPSHENAPPPRQDEAKPPREQAKPMHQDENKPTRQDEAKTPRQDEGKPTHVEGNQPPKRDEARPAQERADHQNDHARPSGQNSAKRGGHIPDEKFRAQFGHSHTFVVNRPVIVEGQPRFQYSGYCLRSSIPGPASGPTATMFTWITSTEITSSTTSSTPAFASLFLL